MNCRQSSRKTNSDRLDITSHTMRGHAMGRSTSTSGITRDGGSPATVEELAATVHPFQRAGLGLAPFRFVGLDTCIHKASHDAPAQPGTSCDYCSTGIMYVCHIESSDGKRFKVGCDCVRKLERHDNRMIS